MTENMNCRLIFFDRKCELLPGFRVEAEGFEILVEVGVSRLVENGAGHLPLGQDLQGVLLPWRG